MVIFVFELQKYKKMMQRENKAVIQAHQPKRKSGIVFFWLGQNLFSFKTIHGKH